MAKLAYRTRGNSNPQGKERVFFACHPNDFEQYFEEICGEIFETQNCVIWYDEDPATDWDSEQMEMELGRMQLFVIPVTTWFLYQKNCAREVLFPFAIEHHIPILPLMQESGLENDFNRICGDLQFLDKNASLHDPTAIPFEQKLERFIASVLLGDEMAAKVRKAFDAYIFLSYRKKDRKYAQELMRLIHQNEFCRDIAIWYDEFLVPGEDFNHAIRDAMEKSELFTFVVTPSLLEKDNYVMTVEYPTAMETKKPILPAEMVPTDREELREHYTKIPDPADAHNATALSAALIDSLRSLAIEGNDEDPEHLFFIGLAYLSGIDVEENRPRGVELITTAAEGNVPEAMEKLSQMYKTGEGVERDYESSARWLENLVAYWEEEFEKNENEEAGSKLQSALEDLGDAWFDMYRFDSAVLIYLKIVNLSHRMIHKFADNRWRCILSNGYKNLGDSYLEMEDLPRARECYEEGLKINETLFRETNTISSLCDLAVAYDKLGRICEAEGDLNDAERWYEATLNLEEQLVQKIEVDELWFKKNLSICYERLGDVCLAKGDLNKAREWCEKDLELIERLIKETGMIELKWNLVLVYDRMGLTYHAEAKLNDAKEWFEKCKVTCEELSGEVETVKSKRALSLSYERLGRMSFLEEDFDKAKKWYEQSLYIIENINRDLKVLELRRSQSSCYLQLGETCSKTGELEEARMWYQKCLNMNEKLERKFGTVESQINVSRSYEGMGNLCRAEGDKDEAKKWYEQAAKILEKLSQKRKKVEFYKDLIRIYDKLGTFDLNIEFFEKSEKIWELLSEMYPDIPVYKDNLNHASAIVGLIRAINEAEG